jgi:hypothetical protein
MMSSIPIGFPSLTHLRMRMNQNVCVSHLELLKSLTNLQLTIDDCAPMTIFMTLRPLASALKWLCLHINIAWHNASTDDQMARRLLPFRSLTYLYLFFPFSGFHDRSYSMEVTGSFINNHWNKLADRSVHLSGSALDLVRVFREFLSLSSITPQPLASPTMASTTNGSSNSMLGMRLRKVLSLDELNEFLEHMESASLLTPSYINNDDIDTHVNDHNDNEDSELKKPKISLEIETIEALQREMTNRVQSRNYANVSSFITRTIVNEGTR